MNLKYKVEKQIYTPKDGETHVHKISIVGLGETGELILARLVNKCIRPVHFCLIDPEDKEKATALMLQFEDVIHFYHSITFSANSAVNETENSDIIIICLETIPVLKEQPTEPTKNTSPVEENSNDGKPVQPTEMPTEDRPSPADYNLNILKKIIPQLSILSPDAIVINCIAPFDILTHIIWKLSKFQKHRVLGLGSCIETKYFHDKLASYCKIPSRFCTGWIFNTWCNEYQFISTGSVTVAHGIAYDFYPSFLEDLNKTNYMTLETIPKFTVSAIVFKLCETIFSDKKNVFPISVYARGLHGIDFECFIALPCLLGSNGVHSVVENNFTRVEINQLRTALVLFKNKIVQFHYKIGLVYKWLFEKYLEDGKKGKRKNTFS